MSMKFCQNNSPSVVTTVVPSLLRGFLSNRAGFDRRSKKTGVIYRETHKNTPQNIKNISYLYKGYYGNSKSSTALRLRRSKCPTT